MSSGSLRFREMSNDSITIDLDIQQEKQEDDDKRKLFTYSKGKNKKGVDQRKYAPTTSPVEEEEEHKYQAKKNGKKNGKKKSKELPANGTGDKTGAGLDQEEKKAEVSVEFSSGPNYKRQPYKIDTMGYKYEIQDRANKILARKNTREKYIIAAMWTINVAFGVINWIRWKYGDASPEKWISWCICGGIFAVWVFCGIVTIANFRRDEDNKTYQDCCCRIFGSRQVRTGIFTASTLVLGILNPSEALVTLVAVVCGVEGFAAVTFYLLKKQYYTKHYSDLQAAVEEVLESFASMAKENGSQDLADKYMGLNEKAQFEMLGLAMELYPKVRSIDDYCNEVDLDAFLQKLKKRQSEYRILYGLLYKHKVHAKDVLLWPMETYLQTIDINPDEKKKRKLQDKIRRNPKEAPPKHRSMNHYQKVSQDDTA